MLSLSCMCGRKCMLTGNPRHKEALRFRKIRLLTVQSLGWSVAYQARIFLSLFPLANASLGAERYWSLTLSLMHLKLRLYCVHSMLASRLDCRALDSTRPNMGMES